MAREGRDLERLVALIEEAVGPEGAEVKSPDFIEDRVTGERREVDVSIRTRVGTSQVLIVIECRDRNSVQDVTWIEQVEQKCRDLKASKVIAVSAKGFSEAALKKAAFSGIETRRMDEISPELIRSWYQAEEMQVIIERVEILYCNLNLDMEGVPRSIEPEVLERMRGITPADTAFMCKKDGLECNLEAVWAWTRRSPAASELYAGVPQDGTRVEKTLNLNYKNPSDRYQLATSFGPLDILSMNLVVRLWIEKTVSPIERTVSYQDGERALVEAVQYEVPVGNGNKRLSFVKDKESGALSVVLSPIEEE
jgi:hypothetical protein